MTIFSVFSFRPIPVRQLQPELDHTGSGVGLGEGGVVSCRGDCCAHRRGSDPGAADHAGSPHAAQRERAAAGPEAADAIPPALQLPRAPPCQKGPCGQAGLGVHGPCDRTRELLSGVR